MAFIMGKRDFFDDDDDEFDDNNNRSWWYGPQAAAIKWSVVGAIFLIALLWFVGGYYHAQRRMKKGLKPLAYHRWLLPRSQRAQFRPEDQFTFYQQQNRHDEGYQLEGYPPPPPAYNPAYAPPPTYQPTVGESKVDPNQEWAVPPPGPPPTSESSTAAQQVRPPPTSDSSNGAPNASEEGQMNHSPQITKPSLLKRFNPFK